MMKSQTILEARELTKFYHDNKAVDHLNLEIKRGEVFGFLGPNGAGKTTTILMILGLTEPTSGSVYVMGYNSTREPLEVKRVTSYLPENVGFYEDMTARENLSLITRLNSLPEKDSQESIEEVLRLIGLEEVKDNEVRTFSKGMKQRLGIGTIFVKKPKLAILDEPTSGIDPQGVRDILDLITKMNKEENITIFLCSHLLYQIQEICNTIGIFSRGKMVATGSLEKISQAILGDQNKRLEISYNKKTNIDTLMKKIEGLEGVLKVEKSMQDISLERIYSKYFREESL